MVKNLLYNQSSEIKKELGFANYEMVHFCHLLCLNEYI